MTISVGRGTRHVFSQFEPLHTTVDGHWTITICDTISKNTTSTYQRRQLYWNYQHCQSTERISFTQSSFIQIELTKKDLRAFSGAKVHGHVQNKTNNR